MCTEYLETDCYTPHATLGRELGSDCRSSIVPRVGFPGGAAWINRLPRQKFNLADQETLLISELIVIRSIFKEFGQKPQQSVPIVDEYPLDGHGFVWVGDKHL